MSAKRKEPTIWKPEDIGADPAKIGVIGRRIKMLKLFQPVHEGNARCLPGKMKRIPQTNLQKTCGGKTAIDIRRHVSVVKDKKHG